MPDIPAAKEDMVIVHAQMHRLRGLLTGVTLALNLEDVGRQDSLSLPHDMVQKIESLMAETHDALRLAGRALASIDEHLKD